MLASDGNIEDIVSKYPNTEDLLVDHMELQYIAIIIWPWRTKFIHLFIGLHLSDHFNKLGYDYKTKNFKVSDLDLLKDKLSHPEFYILPPKNSCYLFNSGVLHGSTINSQKLTRLSLDFRISKVNDKTSTKDLDNYFHYDAVSKEYKIPLHPFHKKPVLKYICGGINKNTYAQHVCIDASAKRYDFILVDQLRWSPMILLKMGFNYLTNT